MKMTLKRFKILVASYGTEISRWPEAERDAGLDLLKEDPAASEVFKAATSLDSYLTAMPKPAKADDTYLKRLATIPFASRSLGEGAPTTFGEFMRGFFPARRMVPQGLGLAVLALLGIWLGFSVNPQPQNGLELDATKYFLENPDLVKDFEDLR